MTRRAFGEPRVYTRAEICAKLKISRATFFVWKKNGTLPLVEWRIGRSIRYHALPIDRLLESGSPSVARRPELALHDHVVNQHREQGVDVLRRER